MAKIEQAGTKVHVPVMPKEVLSLLNISPSGVYVDGTIGIGGHSTLIQNQLSSQGHLIGFDRDGEAIKLCKKTLSSTSTRLTLFNDSYHHLDSILDELDIGQVNGILLDLGLSSLQLDSKSRGFSYKYDSDLDMRFDIRQKPKAFNILNNSSKDELADIIYNYGEERRSRAIAKRIIMMRPIHRVPELIEAIRRSTPPKNRNKTITRVFQAIRIAVNGELEKLDLFLSSFTKRLCIGGRIAIISFHSLEDRKVKHSFKKLKSKGKIKILTKKPIVPSSEEILNNPRSRSAKLRVAERTN